MDVGNAIAKALHQAHLRHQQVEQAVTPMLDNRAIVYREPSTERWVEQHRRFRPEGFYRVHCAHDRARWSVCQQCKRDKREADRNFLLLMTGKLR